jgi:hypothetical protein
MTATALERKGMRAVMTVDSAPDEEWTRRLVLGRENEPDNPLEGDRGSLVGAARQLEAKGRSMELKLELVPVPVVDIDRAKAFYVHRLGFVGYVDVRPTASVRVVQLTPGVAVGLPESGDQTPRSVPWLRSTAIRLRADRRCPQSSSARSRRSHATSPAQYGGLP